jgi:hypothetical protein
VSQNPGFGSRHGAFALLASSFPLIPAFGVNHTVHTFGGIFNLTFSPRGEGTIFLDAIRRGCLFSSFRGDD